MTAVLEKFEKLDPKLRALLAVALIVDGREAMDYLKIDSEHGASFRELIEELGALEPDLRIGLMGTILRRTLAEISG